MQKHTRFYPVALHGAGGQNLPADREILRKPPRAEERA